MSSATGLAPQLPKIRSDSLAHRNVLARRREPACFEWLGVEWQMLLSPCSEACAARHAVELDWGGARVVLHADSACVDEIIRSVVDATPGPATSPLILQAILEAALAGLSTRLERATRKQVRIVGTGELPQRDALAGFGWRLSSESRDSCGELWIDPLGLGFLAEAMRTLAEMPADESEFDTLPIPVRFAIGWVDLPVRALRQAAPRDVLMLDACWLQADERLTVQVGEMAFCCALQGTTLTVTDGWRLLMDEEEEQDLERLADEDEGEDEVSLEEIPVRLNFDLGERMVTLGELRSLAPGYTFDLGRELRRAVRIRANGMAIGEGELVDLDGRLGVSILSLKPTAPR